MIRRGGTALHRTAGCIAWALLFTALTACSRLRLDEPGGNGPPPAGPPDEGDHPVVALVAAAGGPGRARLDWRVHPSTDAPPHLGVFVGEDPATLYLGLPAAEDPVGTSTIVENLLDDAVLYAGLASRAQPSDPWTPTGPVLRVRTGAPVYVDPGAPSGGDGASPETALNDVSDGVQVSFFLYGGGNVWVRDGDAGHASLPLYGGVFLSGGFDPRMRLEARDPIQHPTRVRGLLNQSIVDLHTGNGAAVLDGFELDGLALASNGVQNLGDPVELRSLRIENCERGIKLRSPPTGSAVPVVITGAQVQGCAIEGLSAEGPFDCWIESSAFFRNTREGGKFSDLIAPELGSASVRIQGCVFASNGDEGFECRLQAPPGAGTGGGAFKVLVQDCEFVDNGLEGLVVNIDYGDFPQWSADISVRGCRARANAQHGIHLHLDSTSTCLARRLLASANGGDGLLVTSHDLPVLGLVSASAFLGNRGAGVRASAGQAGILLSHSLLSGNTGGGLVAELAPAAAASSVAWFQPNAWSNATGHASPTQDAALPEPFLRAAREYAEITGLSGESLVLAAPPALPREGPVEVSDDGIPRTIVSSSGILLSVDPAPDAPRVPGVLGLFSAGDSVIEDLHPAASSIALGSGMAPPGGPAVDAGPWGSPIPGHPGKEDPVAATLFRLGSVSPSWFSLGPQDELVLSFVGGRPDPAAAPAAVVLLDARGHPVAISPFVDGDALRVPAPSGSWITGEVLELHAGLRAVGGRPLAAPVALPIRTP